MNIWKKQFFIFFLFIWLTARITLWILWNHEIKGNISHTKLVTTKWLICGMFRYGCHIYYYCSILDLIHTCILHPMNAFLKHSLLQRSLKWILCSAITIIFHHISWAKIIIVYTATILSGQHTGISFHSRFSHSQAFRAALFFLFLLFWHYIRSHVLQICGNPLTEY